MVTLYGRLDWFHEQGMEGNALPIFLDGSKYTTDRFGHAVAVGNGYVPFTNLEDGMHLTIYTSNWVHERDVNKMENEDWQYPRFFEGELDLQQTEIQSVMGFPITVIHQHGFGPDVEHVWLQRRAILYGAGKGQVGWVNDKPAVPGSGSVHYQQTNPVYSFYDSIEEYEQAQAVENAAVVEMFGDNPLDKKMHENALAKHKENPFHIPVLRPAYETWRWMFEQHLCAKLEI